MINISYKYLLILSLINYYCRCEEALGGVERLFVIADFKVKVRVNVRVGGIAGFSDGPQDASLPNPLTFDDVQRRKVGVTCFEPIGMKNFNIKTVALLEDGGADSAAFGCENGRPYRGDQVHPLVLAAAVSGGPECAFSPAVIAQIEAILGGDGSRIKRLPGGDASGFALSDGWESSEAQYSRQAQNQAKKPAHSSEMQISPEGGSQEDTQDNTDHSGFARLEEKTIKHVPHHRGIRCVGQAKTGQKWKKTSLPTPGPGG